MSGENIKNGSLNEGRKEALTNFKKQNESNIDITSQLDDALKENEEKNLKFKEKLEDVGNFYGKNIEELKSYIKKNIDYDNITSSSFEIKDKILSYFIEDGYLTGKGENLKSLNKIISTFGVRDISAENHNIEFEENQKIIFTEEGGDISIYYQDKVIGKIITKKEQD